MRALIRSTGRVGVSQFLLLWADFGAGKTHALRYLEFLARENSHLAPLYVVTPRGVRTFVDLYRAIIDAMHEAGLLQTIGQDIFDRTLKVGVESDLERALIRIPTYNQETAKMALALLRADRVPAAELRELGVSRRLETAADAVNALDQLLGLVRREDRHMLLLLDEMQELADLGRRLPEAVGGLHKVFDRNREGLTMVCSFTTGSQQAVQGIVGDALFAGSMGGGLVSYDEALRTNRSGIFTFPDDTIICPGHGPLTTVGEEKQHNPFFPEFQEQQGAQQQ